MVLIPVLRSGLILEFVLAEGNKGGKETEIIAHFFKVVNTHIGIKKLIKICKGILKGFELDRFGDFDIFGDTISDIRLKVSGVSNGETVPVDDLDLEHVSVDAVKFVGYFCGDHFVVESLSFGDFFHGFADQLHAFDFTQDDIVAVFVGMFDPFEQLDDALLFASDLLDKPFKRLFSVGVIDSKVLSKVSKVTACHTARLRIHELDFLLSALLRNLS
jgi:hypothetical protein